MDTASANFGIYVKPGALDKHQVVFNLSCNDSNTAGSPPMESQFILPVHSPVFIYETYIIEDTNKILKPGDSIGILVQIKDTGLYQATSVQAILSSIDSFITIPDSASSASFIASDSSHYFEFSVTCAPTAPLRHRAQFQIKLSSTELTDTLSFEVHIGTKDFLIWDNDPKHNSALAIKSALEKAGYIGDYTYTLPKYPQLYNYSAIFVCLGIAPNRQYITSSDDEWALCNYLWWGGNLYLEGGDFWSLYGNPNYTLMGYFHTQAINPGKADADTIIGEPESLLKGIKSIYNGENHGMDRLKPDTGAWVISRNKPTEYVNATAFTNGSYKTVAMAYQLGGLDTTSISRVIDTVMKWFSKKINHDVAIWNVESPIDSLVPNTRISPVVIVKNIGKYAEPFKVYCKIDSIQTGVRIYSDSNVVANLSPGDSTELIFKKWNISTGEFNVSFSHNLVDDEPANNIATIRTIALAPLHLVNSTYTSSPPVIDGVIDLNNEWANAVKIDISNVWGKKEAWKYPPGSAFAFIMNDSQNLYLGIDTHCDFNLDLNDGFLLWVTNNADTVSLPLTDSSEGVYIFRHYLKDVLLFKQTISRHN